MLLLLKISKGAKNRSFITVLIEGLRRMKKIQLELTEVPSKFQGQTKVELILDRTQSRLVIDSILKVLTKSFILRVTPNVWNLVIYLRISQLKQHKIHYTHQHLHRQSPQIISVQNQVLHLISPHHQPNCIKNTNYPLLGY